MDEPRASTSILDPTDRIKKLVELARTVEIDPKIPPIRYYRSGVEMERLANEYYDQDSLENAFILYMKFITLFIQKIRTHPDYKLVPQVERYLIRIKLRETLPKAEAIKTQLIEQYKREYERYVTNEKRKEEAAREKRQSMADLKSKTPAAVPESTKTPPTPQTPQPHTNLHITPVQNLLENLMYPLDALAFTSRAEQRNEPISGQPTVNRSSKPNISKKSPYLARRESRIIVVPGNLISQFIALAQTNTFKNVETCGILAGQMKGRDEQLVITHLLVPEQKGTPDTCTTEKEEDLFRYQVERDLITFGWIHTHPTQTAFLSSVDLHTQCSYQLMIPEAVAIVCAPRYSENKFFCLTKSYGLDVIANCDHQGFHPHDTEKELYSVADHVKVDNTISVEIVDLRRTKS